MCIRDRAWIRSSSNLPALALSSIVLIVLSGIYLAARIRAWPIAWIQVSLGAVIVIGVLGALVGTRLRAMRKIAADDSGESLDTYRLSVADAALQTPIRTRLTTALAIVLLMVTRPDRNTSVSYTHLDVYKRQHGSFHMGLSPPLDAKQFGSQILPKYFD